uniref:Uncharacterized protein n=1 Tax=Macaca fascicularis TaxID=9541 RepID=A0A7N9CRF1_MACFA
IIRIKMTIIKKPEPCLADSSEASAERAVLVISLVKNARG